MTLFPKENFVGTFGGFAERGLEFHAEIVVPYNANLGQRPIQGHFVLVALEGDDEGVLGRITNVQSQGRLTSSVGEDYVTRAAIEDREVPDDLRERYLKYKIDIRNLGVLREASDGNYSFVPSHRRMPHVGAKVGFLSDDVLRFVASAELRNEERIARLGYLAFGEFIYAGDDGQLTVEDWMELHAPSVPVTFPITSLVSRRAFVFARAGFGKSNLMKLLLAQLYEEPPTEQIAGRDIPVGTLVFDPEGEYFWPDYRNRAGLADVPALRDHLVVFTDRQPPSQAYGSFVAGPVRFDLRRLHARKVTKIVFSAERLEQVNVQALHRLSDQDWSDLVDALHERRNQDARAIVEQAVRQTRTSSGTIDVIVDAALGNAGRLVRDLHNPSSSMLDDLRVALADGKLCVVDLSLMRGKAGNNLAGVILDHFFEHNQHEFTRTHSQAIPVIAVIEEAQSVLSADQNTGDSGPFVVWAKEGRKYALGSILITQQPGSIPFELLSQADNCFAFHLLSEGDLQTLRRANGHFSSDLLASLLNEPIPGTGLVWSSVNQKPYPLPVRVLDFQASIPRLLDEARSGEAVETYAGVLRERREERTARVRALASEDLAPNATEHEVLLAAYVSAVEREHGKELRHGKSVRYGSVMKTQKEVLLASGLEMDDNAAFARVRSEALTIQVVERVAGLTLSQGLEIIDGETGKEFMIRQPEVG